MFDPGIGFESDSISHNASVTNVLNKFIQNKLDLIGDKTHNQGNDRRDRVNIDLGVMISTNLVEVH